MGIPHQAVISVKLSPIDITLLSSSSDRLYFNFVLLNMQNLDSTARLILVVMPKYAIRPS
ncbi:MULTISPECIES: hypothetical protein [unclassified Chamaesiphon]|uniref:hypothetical protein n=1 Tax=unclassified Chamaesiphon TaxID=2620921 RepID=UPI00286B48C7|nr:MULTISPECIES: hypothetical protein [unclassified Chamaesiphon]